MKKIYLLAALLINLTCQAQKDVSLQIHHFLGSTSFAFNQTATSQAGIDFQLSRMEYYIAEIELTYDGGQDTVIQGKWILVDAASTTTEFLGTFDITSLESISFGIGVENSYNHTDPASYPANHPLSPKSPSMHWGWTAGYRFIAMEGSIGPNNDILEIHALGDVNYLKQTIATSGVTSGNEITIKIAADYVQAFNNLELSGGLVYHGEQNESAILISNFNNYVFSEASPTVGIADMKNKNFNFYPNPASSNGAIFLPPSSATRHLEVIDITGKIIATYPVAKDGMVDLNIPGTGFYVGVLYEDEILIGTKKIIITK